MKDGIDSLRYCLLIATVLVSMSFSAACRSGEEDSPTAAATATEITLAFSTPVELVASPAPTETNTPEAVEPTVAQPTVTSPVPTRTPTPSPTPSPTPLPEPTTYVVESGDTLLGIAERFNVSIEALAFANGAASPAELSIIAGQLLQIPICQVHQVVAGNTLAAIALSCGVTLDDLVTANIKELAVLGSLDAIPLGFKLYIPQESSIPEDLDCNPLPERQQVIEYSPAPGEGVFCLSQKYGLSTTTIISANTARLAGSEPYGEVPLLILPFDGALYSVTSEDVENEVILDDLAAWYEVEPGSITDWSGNSVEEPLFAGQQLMIAGANLSAGPFQFEQPEAG